MAASDHLNGVEPADPPKATFLFVHGAGFGAWCWYKVIHLLKKEGYGAVAIDLAGAGIDRSDPNKVTTFEQMGKSLFDYVAGFSGPGKITIVGHSLGGLLVSLAMEKFPEKISSAVFVAANMALDGDNLASTVPDGAILSSLATRNSVFVFDDPTSKIPTSGYLTKEILQSHVLNRCPQEDVELTFLLIRPVPYRPTVERVHLTKEKYGSIKTFYIRSLYDHAVPLEWQDFNVQRNPGATVFTLESDHAPFFCKPVELKDLILKALE